MKNAPRLPRAGLPFFGGLLSLALVTLSSTFATAAEPVGVGGNPLFPDLFTADPAPMVVGDTVYLYTGHDEARGNEMFTMKEWLCFSSKDMKHWTAHGPIMRATDFKWATQDAWAAQAVFRNGKYYFYTSVRHGEPHVGMAIGVAVSDSPTGPFVDARGSALVTDDMTPSPYPWDDIDPTVFIDDDGTAWLAWGNPLCHLAKLKPNMIELDGPIVLLPLANYTEGPWISKRNGLYYLTYPAFAHQGFSESLCYATAPEITGPWTYRGVLTGTAKNSYTIHPGIVDDFNGQSYLFYHNAALTLPDGQSGAVGRRAVCAEYLYYDKDGMMLPVTQTEAGISVPPQPDACAAPKRVDRGTTDSRISIPAISHFFPRAWEGAPVLASVADPFYATPVPYGLNKTEDATNMGQSFVPERDCTLGSLVVYAGDGYGTDADNPLTLALYDLGPAASSANPETYSVDANLLGDGKGLGIAYEVQAPGLLTINFAKEAQVALTAGHRYVIELQGAKKSPCIYWRGSRSDVYAGGAAYEGRRLAKDNDGATLDFSFAIYEAR
jgi:hypothetical protein